MHDLILVGQEAGAWVANNAVSLIGAFAVLSASIYFERSGPKDAPTTKFMFNFKGRKK